jgi:hypothetical protein
MPLPGITKDLHQDHLPVLHRQLRSIGEVDHIGLILHTRGGDTSVPWPLVNNIRAFCKRFTLFVPFRAHSAGTLIAMGADEIVMTKVAELSPVDPTTANQFNPRDAANPQQVLGISVEDLSAFIELCKDRIGIRRNDASAILESLTRSVSPISLGNVQRTYNQIRLLARKLLGLHMDASGHQAKKIRGALTERLYSHLHFIDRHEARDDIGLNVTDASAEEDDLLWEVYEDYFRELHLDEHFKVRDFLGTKLEDETSLRGAFIETCSSSYVYEGRCRIGQSSILPDNVLAQLLQAQKVVSRQLIPGFPVRLDVVTLGEGWVEQ